MFGGADMRSGDVLLSLDGQPVPDLDAVERFFAQATDGQQARIFKFALLQNLSFASKLQFFCSRGSYKKVFLQQALNCQKAFFGLEKNAAGRSCYNVQRQYKNRPLERAFKGSCNRALSIERTRDSTPWVPLIQPWPTARR